MTSQIISADDCSAVPSLHETSTVPSTGTMSMMAARHRLLFDRFTPLFAFAVLLGLWEGACRVFAIPSFLLPAPSAIAAALVATPLSSWADHAAATLRVALLGYALAIAVSIPLAVGIANSRFMRRTLFPILIVVQSTPIVAIAPIIVVTLGAHDLPRVIITFLITFFPILVSTVTGLQSTPGELIELSRSLRAGRSREILHVRLPFAMPYLFSALKISTTLAIIGAVVAEFVAADRGLGFFIAFATSNFRIPTAFAGLTVLVAISLSLFQLVSWLQMRLVPWSISKSER